MGLHVIVMMGTIMICPLVQPVLSYAKNVHQTLPLRVLSALLEHMLIPLIPQTVNAYPIHTIKSRRVHVCYMTIIPLCFCTDSKVLSTTWPTKQQAHMGYLDW